MRYEGSTFLILRRMTMGTHDNPKLYDQRLESYLPGNHRGHPRPLTANRKKVLIVFVSFFSSSIVSLNLICETPWRLKPTSFSICFLLDLSQSIRTHPSALTPTLSPQAGRGSMSAPSAARVRRAVPLPHLAGRMNGAAYTRGRSAPAHREISASSRRFRGRSACAGFRWSRRRSRRVWRRAGAGRPGSR
jgi:hypothetical protein